MRDLGRTPALLALNLSVDQVTSPPLALGDENGRRDLPGLRRFINETRGNESGYVAHRLRRLETAARGDSTDLLKQEALETVELVCECLANRGANQQKKISWRGTAERISSAFYKKGRPRFSKP